MLGIENEGGEGKYLGLPECFSGSKKKLLAFITEKLTKRLNGWYAKTLSLGGKEILLKSVAMALPVYAMSCFRLTKHQCQTITSAMASFWWNACEKKNKIHWTSWSELCKSKENGGLGFRDVSEFNQALLAKQAWKILNEPRSLLARLYKGRYFADQEFLECGKGIRPSYAWRSIIYGRELLQSGLMKSIGDGKETGIWTDKWLFDNEPRRPMNIEMSIDLELKVSSLLSPDLKWREDRVRELFPPADVDRILRITPGKVRDRYIWAYTTHGAYSVRSGQWFTLNRPLIPPDPISAQDQTRNELKKKTWKIHTEPKIRFFLWRVLSGALAVATRLNTRGLDVDLRCKLCRRGAESINHVLFHCQMAQQLLLEAQIPFPVAGFAMTVEENMTFLFDVMVSTTVAENIKHKIPWALWNIWKNRNAILYSGNHESTALVVKRIGDDAHAWKDANDAEEQSDNGDLIVSACDNRWHPPARGVIKCNMHVNWRNQTLHTGAAWIARDYMGEVRFHAREAFTCSPNRTIGELKGVVWVLQSLKDLRLRNMVISLDCKDAFEAITSPQTWPRVRTFTTLIESMSSNFEYCHFELESQKANHVARAIAKSVLRDGRFQSYLALGGPSWLHNQVQRDIVCV